MQLDTIIIMDKMNYYWQKYIDSNGIKFLWKEEANQHGPNDAWFKCVFYDVLKDKISLANNKAIPLNNKLARLFYL